MTTPKASQERPKGHTIYMKADTRRHLARLMARLGTTCIADALHIAVVHTAASTQIIHTPPDTPRDN